MNRKHQTLLLSGVLALVALVAAVCLLRTCGREKAPGALPETRREAAYASFLQNGCYDSPEDGRNAAAQWMGYFEVIGDSEKASEAETVLNAFLLMEDFFGRDFPSERSFRSQMGFMAKRFTGSPYPVVRRSWESISAGQERRR